MSEIDVKALREHLGETQAEFAGRFGVDQGTVSNWETRKSRPSGPARKLMGMLAAAKTEAAA